MITGKKIISYTYNPFNKKNDAAESVANKSSTLHKIFIS